MIIYSDLDGTFLDHESYSSDASLPVLKKALESGAEVVFCSSKTRAEIEALLSSFNLYLPFISENGGGIFIPEGHALLKKWNFPKSSSFHVFSLGRSYAELTDALAKVSEEIGADLRGFSSMSEEEVSALCGFGIEESRLAKMRDFDEPFIFESNDSQLFKRAEDSFAKMGMQITKGGRFCHLMGSNDKGIASRMVTSLFKRVFEKVVTVGIGDSENDLPLLEAVDRPILVQKSDGNYDEAILKQLPKTALAKGIGPVGWAKAISKLIARSRDARFDVSQFAQP